MFFCSRIFTVSSIDINDRGVLNMVSRTPRRRMITRQQAAEIPPQAEGPVEENPSLAEENSPVHSTAGSISGSFSVSS